MPAGDLTDAELIEVNSRGVAINNFVSGSGDPTKEGGLFAMAESPSSSTVEEYGWLASLTSGINVIDVGSGGASGDLELTPEGQAAFPGLSNADLSAGPYHNYFTATNDDFGNLKPIFIDPTNDRVVGLGGDLSAGISNQGPTVTDASTTADEGDFVAKVIEATDPDADPLTFSVRRLHRAGRERSHPISTRPRSCSRGTRPARLAGRLHRSNPRHRPLGPNGHRHLHDQPSRFPNPPASRCSHSAVWV